MFASSNASVSQASEASKQTGGFQASCMLLQISSCILDTSRDLLTHSIVLQGNISVLVATDVAARGLDIPDVNAVVNYDFPTGVCAWRCTALLACTPACLP